MDVMFTKEIKEQNETINIYLIEVVNMCYTYIQVKPAMSLPFSAIVDWF